ncbi:MAG: hypothetical protein JNN04_15105 [Cyclobacteriaceae bacterium]|nr:hypothetical protein [Cyclobacteriaceae bacterium]
MAGVSAETVAQEADTFDISSASMYYPHRMVPGDFSMEVAMSQVKLPFDWLETAIQAPLFHFHALYGLPRGFSIDGRFSSLFVSNQIALGPHWSYQKNKISFNVGYDVGYTFGYLNQFGFASSAQSWINYPNASFGFRFKDVAFTLKGELMVITAFSTKQGDNEISTEKNFSNGGSLAIYMEQRIHKNKVLVIGLKNSYAKYHFMAWPAFSTFNRFYNIPEFYVGLIL